MESANMPIQAKSAKRNTSCLKIAGISCLVMLIALGGLIFWLYSYLRKNPSVEQMAGCMVNLGQISGAMTRYTEKNSKYPDNMIDLYPNFLEKKAYLHCPADPSAEETVSYEYKKPDMKSPPATIVASCKRHRVLNTTIWLSLMRDGKIRQFSVPPGKDAKPVPGMDIDPKSLQR